METSGDADAAKLICRAGEADSSAAIDPRTVRDANDMRMQPCPDLLSGNDHADETSIIHRHEHFAQ
ncbi:hypothetical protein [Falsirhodobacter xinxiangensis]|uniref:hypothetical protein n=1 Tax=Falsirhodobacter xinxiangensis TaxID=2530049 RepID=UPI001C704946|nr:hypothetical protein [Rhodobacter xinxiangensis]